MNQVCALESDDDAGKTGRKPKNTIAGKDRPSAKAGDLLERKSEGTDQNRAGTSGYVGA